MRNRQKLPSKTAGEKSDSVTETAGIERGADNTSLAISPLDYMLSVMRDPEVEPARRDEMAKLALPYMHPKAALMDEPGKGAGTAEAMDISDTDVARRIGFILARATRTKGGKS
jgi:hypothetical protein